MQRRLSRPGGRIYDICSTGSAGRPAGAVGAQAKRAGELFRYPPTAAGPANAAARASGRAGLLAGVQTVARASDRGGGGAEPQGIATTGASGSRGTDRKGGGENVINFLHVFLCLISSRRCHYFSVHSQSQDGCRQHCTTKKTDTATLQWEAYALFRH